VKDSYDALPPERPTVRRAALDHRTVYGPTAQRRSRDFWRPPAGTVRFGSNGVVARRLFRSTQPRASRQALQANSARRTHESFTDTL